MSRLTTKTKMANKESVQHDWYIVDAEGQTLGRMVTAIATVLRGKNKPYYSPHLDCGDFVIVINSDKIRLTGAKWDQKEYITYSGYQGGQKREAAKDLNKRKPTAIVENAVKGMLPKNRLGRQLFKKLFVYAEAEHPHTAQQPKPLNIK